jgi:hypothetical protein
MFGASQVFQTISHRPDDAETFINLSHQEKTGVSSYLSTLKIDPDSPIKIRPNHLFPAFTIDEHFGPLEIAYYPSLYHIVMLISGNSCGIIQDYNGPRKRPGLPARSQAPGKSFSGR